MVSVGHSHQTLMHFHLHLPPLFSAGEPVQSSEPMVLMNPVRLPAGLTLQPALPRLRRSR